MDSLIVITINEDGDHRFEQVVRDQLAKRLTENYYGRLQVKTDWPSERDMGEWPPGIWIIEGQLRTPRAVEVVTRYEI